MTLSQKWQNDPFLSNHPIFVSLIKKEKIVQRALNGSYSVNAESLSMAILQREVINRRRFPGLCVII